MSRVAAILLAAGRSDRMGAFKPLLPFGNSSVIKTCVEYLSRGGADQILVVVGHRAPEIREHLIDKSLEFVINDQPGGEMSVSIAYGMRALPENVDATLIALVDQPAVSPSVVTHLIQTWKQGARLIIPTWQQRGGHPVLIDLRFRDELLNLDASQGLKSFFEAHRSQVVRLATDSPYIARDMDTWDDYVTLHRDVIGREPPAPLSRNSNETSDGII